MVRRKRRERSGGERRSAADPLWERRGFRLAAVRRGPRTIPEIVTELYAELNIPLVAAAMDTASPFEGMGAAREAYFPIICEATMFMILILYRIHREWSLKTL